MVSRVARKPKTADRSGFLLHCSEVQPMLWSRGRERHFNAPSDLKRHWLQGIEQCRNQASNYAAPTKFVPRIFCKSHKVTKSMNQMYVSVALNNEQTKIESSTSTRLQGQTCHWLLLTLVWICPLVCKHSQFCQFWSFSASTCIKGCRTNWVSTDASELNNIEGRIPCDQGPQWESQALKISGSKGFVVACLGVVYASKEKWEWKGLKTHH